MASVMWPALLSTPRLSARAIGAQSLDKPPSLLAGYDDPIFVDWLHVSSTRDMHHTSRGALDVIYQQNYI